MKPALLIVDDDEEIATQMKWALVSDYDVHLAGTRAAALEMFHLHHPPVVLLDLGLPPSPASPDEGLAALSEFLALDPLTKVVVITGQGEREVSLKAVGAGAYDFLGKPVQMEELRLLLRRSVHVAQLEREYRKMRDRADVDPFEGVLGNSQSMQAAFAAVSKVATTDAPVLLLGESGTGKEITARAIHRRNARRNGPFVAINCGAIPEPLMESELFGHEKGAFTGAHIQRKGRIESASGGTLFLDEIGDIAASLQVKLLRFLQEQRIERVGGRQEIIVDARVIAATSVDLKKALINGSFREDLYYRLAVVQIVLPPLRDRDEDVLLLAETFRRRFAAECGKSGVAFSQDALRALRRHPWPGNVRELQNRVRRAVIMGGGKRLTAEDLELADAVVPGAGGTLKQARENLERVMVLQALKTQSGRISAAAAHLGVSRPTFYELMARLGIRRTEEGPRV